MVLGSIPSWGTTKTVMNTPALVALAFRQEGGLISFTLPRGDYLVNGTYRTIELFSELVIADELDLTILKLQKVNKLVKYKRDDTELSVEEFEAEKERKLNLIRKRSDLGLAKAILSRCEYDDFVSSFTPIYDTVTESHKVEIQVQGEAPIMTNKYIVPIRKITGDLANTLYLYDRDVHMVEALRDELSKVGFDFNVQNGRPSLFIDGNGIEFAKVFDGESTKYLNAIVPELSKFKRPNKVSGTFADLERQFNENKELVDTVVRVVLRQKEALDKVTIQNMLGDLSTLSSHLASVDSKRATVGSLIAAKDVVRKMIRCLQKGS